MSAGETKACPFCAETIKVAAVLCRFCGRELIPPGATVEPDPAPGSAPLAERLVASSRIERPEIFDMLTALVEKSLVIYEEDEQGVGRYRLMETVRQYSQERLLEGHEGKGLRQRHAAVFLTFAEEMVRDLSRKEPVAWLGRLDRELDNVRAALDWTLGSDPATALRLAGVLARVWNVRGHLIEGREWLERGSLGNWSPARSHSHFLEGREWLERALAASREAPPSLRATALNHLSALLYWQGDYVRLTEVVEESRTLAQQGGDKESLASALGMLALLALLHGDRVRAGKLGAEATALFREAGVASPRARAGVVVTAAGLAAATASDQPTIELFREAQAVCRATGDPFFIGGCCRTEALFALQRGDHPRALVLNREGLIVAQEAGHTIGVHNALEGIAAVWAAQGRSEQAARLMGAAEALRGTAQWPNLPFWVEQQAQARASARAALGAETFAAAWAEGRAMSLPEAIEYALEQEETCP